MITIHCAELYASTEHALARNTYTVQAGDQCPRELDKSIFSEDQLDYLDAFFCEYERRSHERQEYLLNTGLINPASKPRTRAINLALIDYINGNYAQGSDRMELADLAKHFRWRKETMIEQRERIIERFLGLLKIEKNTP